MHLRSSIKFVLASSVMVHPNGRSKCGHYVDRTRRCKRIEGGKPPIYAVGRDRHSENNEHFLNIDVFSEMAQGLCSVDIGPTGHRIESPKRGKYSKCKIRLHSMA